MVSEQLDFPQALALLNTAWDANASDADRKAAAELLVKATYIHVLLPLHPKEVTDELS